MIFSSTMVAASHALSWRKAGGYTLFDLPPDALWGQLREHAVQERL